MAGLGLARAASGPNERIRLALIGSGGRGRSDLAFFLANPDVECVAVCDVDDRMIAAGLEGVRKVQSRVPDTAKDFRRVLDRKDVDACIVATPDHWHALPAVYACQAGKDVYLEKPMATSVVESRAVVRATRRHNRVVQVGTQWRSGAHYQEAVEFVQSGKLGKIRQVRAWAYLDWVGGIGRPADGDPPAGVDYDMWLGPAPQRPFNPNRFHFNFRWHWDYAGGLMTDWGVHLLNLALWAMGPTPPTSVTSVGSRSVVDDNSDTPDTQTALYEFPAHPLIWEHQMLGGLGIAGKPHGVSFSGSEATLIVDRKGWEVAAEPKKKDLTIKRTVSPQDPDGDGRKAHIRNFLDCIKSRRDPVMTVEAGHFATATAHLGNVALLSGNRIVWDGREEKVVNDPKAARLLGREYRKPWSLPYSEA